MGLSFSCLKPSTDAIPALRPGHRCKTARPDQTPLGEGSSARKQSARADARQVLAPQFQGLPQKPVQDAPVCTADPRIFDSGPLKMSVEAVDPTAPRIETPDVALSAKTVHLQENAKAMVDTLQTAPSPASVKAQMSRIEFKRYAKCHAEGNFDQCLKILGDRGAHAVIFSEPTFDAKALCVLAEGSTHFHGSRSASLLMFDRSARQEHRGRLVPTGQLVASGVAPFSGELGCAMHKKSLNENHVSVVDAANLRTAYDYACNLHTQTWSPGVVARATQPSVSPEPIGIPDEHAESKGLGKIGKELARKKFDLAQKQLHQWQLLPEDGDSRRLVQMNFATLYGVTLPESAQLASGGMPGEVGVLDGCPLEQMKVLFVPAQHVEFVSSFVAANGFAIPVKSISGLQPFL